MKELKQYDIVVYFKGGARRSYVDCMKMASDKHKVPVAFIGYGQMGDINKVSDIINRFFEE